MLVADSGGGGGFSSARAEVVASYNKMKTAIDTALTTDGQELTQALSRQGIQASDGFNTWLSTLKTDLTTVRAKVAEHWGVFEANLDVPDKLKTSADKYFTTKGHVETLMKDVDTAHGRDKPFWDSQAGSQVWAKLETQKAALAELGNVALQQYNGCTYIAWLHEGINSALNSSLNWVITVVPKDAADANATTFYKRSDTARNALNYLAAWMATASSTSGTWSTTAYQIRDEINNVYRSTNVLGQDGQWPKASVANQTNAQTDTKVSTFAFYVDSDWSGRQQTGRSATG